MVTKVRSHLRVYSFSSKHEPVLAVRPESVILFETRDAFDNQVDLNLKGSLDLGEVDMSRVNPATGPVWIEGALPGQTLEVEILDVKVGDKGFIGRRVFKIAEGVIEMDSLRIPVRPVVGVMGVAPLRGEVSTKDQGDYGGNLDTPELSIGSKVFLPVWVEGGLLALGDVHAAQGDGEVSGQRLEVSAKVKVIVRLHPRRILDRVLIDTGRSTFVLASSESYDRAIEEALESANILLQRTLGLSRQDALSLLSLTSNLGISQIVNPKKTVKVEIPKDIVPIDVEKLLSAKGP